MNTLRAVKYFKRKKELLNKLVRIFHIINKNNCDLHSRTVSF